MKKILIVSHLPLGDETNVGKTLNNLFDKYPPHKLCQIFFKDYGNKRTDINSFYIGDQDVLESLIKRTSKCGREYDFNSRPLQKSISTNTNINLRSPFSLLLRDLVWKISGYFNKGLYDWIMIQKPEAIFLAPGYSSFAYELCGKLSRIFSIPLYIYIMEDFYNEIRNTISPMFWVRYFIFRNSVRKCIKHSSKILTLNEGLTLLYADMFKCSPYTIFNPVNKLYSEPFNNEGINATTLLYAGSIGNSRIDVIEKIGDAIVEIQKTTKLLFKVYGAVQNESILSRLTSNNGIIYGGLINSKELEREIRKSDIVVHVESFNEKYIAKTKLALSTKIPEYLGSGKLLLAIGPSIIESMRYLQATNSAYIINDESLINEKLKFLLNNISSYYSLIENAINVARKNHDKQKIQSELYSILNS